MVAAAVVSRVAVTGAHDADAIATASIAIATKSGAVAVAVAAVAAIEVAMAAAAIALKTADATFGIDIDIDRKNWLTLSDCADGSGDAHTFLLLSNLFCFQLRKIKKSILITECQKFLSLSANISIFGSSR